MYRVLLFYDRVCIDIHETRFTKHYVCVYRVPNSNINFHLLRRIYVAFIAHYIALSLHSYSYNVELNNLSRQY